MNQPKTPSPATKYEDESEASAIYALLQQGLRQMADQNGRELDRNNSGAQTQITDEAKITELSSTLRLERPPRPELGDWALPCFPLAKTFRCAPQKLAQTLAAIITEIPESAQPNGRWQVEASGAYVNFSFPKESRGRIAAATVEAIAAAGGDFGRNAQLAGQKIMVEFSGPNTNKPLHLGHLRNNVLGESISRILRASGAELNKVNIINDRGVHICKSMLAYERFGQKQEGHCWETPETSGKKGDHLVGEYYVRFNEWAARSAESGSNGNEAESETKPPEAPKNADSPEQLAQQMLRDWEAGDARLHRLWQKMNRWVLDGILETYRRCDISFDRLYFESETYQLGLKLVAEGLERGIFARREDGAVYIDLGEHGLDQKIVQRSDGTALYITQDIGTAVSRHEDFPFDRQIYVVGSEQGYHFQVLFHILRRFGFPWAKQLYHLSYGMVLLPEGKMKSREGTVVDADALLDQLEELAREGLQQRNPDRKPDDGPARQIALAALHYYLLQFNPQREISFNPKESLSFTGNTGPYLQYVGARICSILRKADAAPHANQYSGWEQLLHTDENSPEWELVGQLRSYPESVALAAEELNPAHVIKRLEGIGRCFSRFYHEVPILSGEEPLRSLRLSLCRATLQVLQNGMKLCVIPFLKNM